MIKLVMIVFFLTGFIQAQDPFVPMKMAGSSGFPSRAGARADWVRLTNQRMEMSHKSLRVALGDDDGLTLVVLAPEVTKKRQAKPILLGKGDHALLFKSMVAEGFNRVVVRNPDTGDSWGARLEQGQAILD